MAKAAESEPLDLEEDVEEIEDEIKKPDDKKKDTPYGNDYTTNFAQAPDSPRYPDEDKGYKSETYIGGKKKKFTKEDSQAIKEHYENEFKRQRVDDEDAAASYYGDVAQPKVGTKLNNPDTPAGKFFRNQPKEVRQHQEHRTYDPEIAEKWKAVFDLHKQYFSGKNDKPAEKGLTINGDARQNSNKQIGRLLGEAAGIGIGAGLGAASGAGQAMAEGAGKPTSDVADAVGEAEDIPEKVGAAQSQINEGTEKSHQSNCPYCNNAGKNKQHDENPDKFHAWMDSERQKSMLTNTRFMNKIESADPSTVQHQPKTRKPHLDTGKSPFKTPSSEIDAVRERGSHRAMPKGKEPLPFKVLRGSKTKKPYIISSTPREQVDPDAAQAERSSKDNVSKTIPKSAPIGIPTKETAPVKDIIAPSTNPKNLPAMYKDPSGKTPDTGKSPNLKPSKGKLGYLKDKNPFKGSGKKPKKQEGYLIDAGNIGAKVGGDNPNRSVKRVPHGVAAQDISNKSFYSLRTKDGYGSGDLSLQNVIPNTVVDDKETYIGQTASGKHRMVDRNKITNTRIGDDIHYYVNGIEDRGIVVKMGSEYIQVFKEDGNFHDVHINDTFFVKDIVVNKTWDNMDATERVDALNKIHAPSPRFVGKSWHELPVEIKDLLTKKLPKRVHETGKQIPAENPIFTPPAPKPLNTQADENTKYFSTTGKLLGTGEKGRQAQSDDLKNASEDFRKLKPTYQGDAEEKEKSDVEQGTYGNVGNTSDVAPSTSTNLDVSESTGYEERPHISVEEVGSLPRRDAKDNDDDETKEKEDDIKEPKESKDTQKVGVPTANYNTFGITYAVKANTVWNKKTQRWEQKDEE